MSYDKRIKGQGLIYAHQTAFNSLREDLVAYRSLQVYFTANTTGTMNIRGTFNYSGYTLNVYIGTTEEIDTNTGIPISYLASGQDSFSFNVSANTTYVVTVQGLSSIPTGTPAPVLTAQASYTSYNYELITRLLKTDEYGTQYTTFPSFRNNFTYVQPVKFSINIGVRFYEPNATYGTVRVYVTTSQQGINADGTPVASSILSTDQPHLRPSFTATANTVYYIYYRIIGSRATTNIAGTAYCCKNNSGQTATVNVSITDGYSTQGTYTDYIYASDWLTEQNLKIVGNERIVCWVPKNLDLSYYRRYKFVGWYSSNDFRSEHLLSTNPEYKFTPLTSTTNLYGLVYGETNDFSFTTNIASGQPFKITAEEWNDFVSYCAFKYNKATGRSETFGYNTLTTSIAPYSGYMKQGSQLYAQSFNKIKYHGIDQAGVSVLPPTSEVSSGDKIYAAYINNLLTEARSIT